MKILTVFLITLVVLLSCDNASAHYRKDDQKARHIYEVYGAAQFKGDEAYEVMQQRCLVNGEDYYTVNVTEYFSESNPQVIYSYECDNGTYPVPGTFYLEENHCGMPQDSDESGTNTCITASHGCAALVSTVAVLNTTSAVPEPEVNYSGCHASYANVVNPHPVIADCYVANYVYTGQLEVDKFPDLWTTAQPVSQVPVSAECNNGFYIPPPVTVETCSSLAGISTVLTYADGVAIPDYECISNCYADWNFKLLNPVDNSNDVVYEFLPDTDANFGTCDIGSDTDTPQDIITGDTGSIDSRLDKIIQQNVTSQQSADDLQTTTSAGNGLLSDIEAAVNGSVTGGDDCITPPVCVGSELQCFQIKQNWESACAAGDDSTPLINSNDIGFDDTATTFSSRVQASPLFTAFAGVSNMISADAGACPVLAFDLPAPISQNVSTSIHCDLWTTISPVVSTVMLVVFTFMGFRIIASA